MRNSVGVILECTMDTMVSCILCVFASLRLCEKKKGKIDSSHHFFCYGVDKKKGFRFRGSPLPHPGPNEQQGKKIRDFKGNC